MIIPRSKTTFFTQHAKAKMSFYKLSPSRVVHVLHTPRRVEEGVAPKTIAAMQPGNNTETGLKESWTQEIWVMFQDSPKERKIISAWRYPGVTKPRSAVTQSMLQEAYESYKKLP